MLIDGNNLTAVEEIAAGLVRASQHDLNLHLMSLGSSSVVRSPCHMYVFSEEARSSQVPRAGNFAGVRPTSTTEIVSHRGADARRYYPTGRTSSIERKAKGRAPMTTVPGDWLAGS